MPSISIIVPVYNVEKYVSQCIYSIRRQTCSDIEVICVDDGSTDSSLDVVGMHASCDSRIKVVRKKNGGLSSARNAGIRESTGKYLLFVDSDDFLEPDACEKVLSRLEEEKADVVTFGANRIPQSASNPWLDTCLSPKNAVYEGFSTELLFNESSRPYIWRSAIRRAFLEEENLFFDESVLFGEDQVFYFDLYALSSKTVLCSDCLYDYRLSRKGSLMETTVGDLPKRVCAHIDIVDTILGSWEKRDLIRSCPSELIDWILDFLFEDMFRLPAEGKAAAYARLGKTVKKYFVDPLKSAQGLGGHARKVIEGMLSCSENGLVPSWIGREYTLYRIGWSGYLRNIFLRIKDVAKSSGSSEREGESNSFDLNLVATEELARLFLAEIRMEYALVEAGKGTGTR